MVHDSSKTANLNNLEEEDVKKNSDSDVLPSIPKHNTNHEHPEDVANVNKGNNNHPSYVSSCSDSSYDQIRSTSDSSSSPVCETNMLSKDSIKIENYNETMSEKGHDEDEQCTELPKQVLDSSTETDSQLLSNRVKSLEAQLETLQKLLTKVIETKEEHEVNANLPKVHRVSSMIPLNDSDADLKCHDVLNDCATAQSPQRALSPSPNLEYRSYTPTYEEELHRYRKSSRGMSIENLNIIDKDAEKCENVPNIETQSKSKEYTERNANSGDKSTIDRYENLAKNDSSDITITKREDEAMMNDNEILSSGGNKTATVDKKGVQSIGNGHGRVISHSDGIFKSKIKGIMIFLDSLNLDSKQQDGSASEDIDANMEEFLRVPYRIEELMAFGILICTDSFLHVLTVTPLKFIWSCICLFCTIFNPGKSNVWCRFHRRHLYQLVRVFVIYAVYKYFLVPISIGKMYHWIRGQAMLKLYVLMAMVEVFDRLMCSFGQDALDSLFWNTTHRPFHPRMVLSILVVLVYAIVHSYILFVHVATLNVAMNSADQTLLTLLISGNFAEIKSTVFKKYNKQNLFKIVTSDICERFKLVLFLSLVLLLNCSQGGMNQEMVNDYVYMSGLILFAEMLCDWIKHSFITKFNFIKSAAYQDYALILAGDITGVGKDGLNIDNTHSAVKRIGFAQIPLVCVMARYVAEAVRYADILSDEGDSNHVLYPMAVLLTRGTWIQIATFLFKSLMTLLLLKAILNHFIEKTSRTVIMYGPSVKEESKGKNELQRRQAV